MLWEFSHCVLLKCANHVCASRVSFSKPNLDVLVLVSFWSTSQTGSSICYGYMVGIIKSEGEKGTCKNYYRQNLVGNVLNINKGCTISCSQLFYSLLTAFSFSRKDRIILSLLTCNYIFNNQNCLFFPVTALYVSKWNS